MKEKQHQDEFEGHLGLVVACHVRGSEVPTYGRLVETGPTFITLEKKDGRKLLVRKSDVITVYPTKNNNPEAL